MSLGKSPAFLTQDQSHKESLNSHFNPSKLWSLYATNSESLDLSVVFEGFS